MRLKELILLSALFALLQVCTGLWVAQRYDYPKDGAIDVARFGLERGGRYEIDVSFRFLVNIPSALMQQTIVRDALVMW